MPERTFFDLRYAVPGYTLILMIILVGYPVLKHEFLQVGDVTLVAAFLAFLSLLSGGALGFLVSQAWYAFYHPIMRGKYGNLPQTIEFLVGEYSLTTKDPHRQIVFLDYVIRLSDRQLMTYAQRRFDLMHLCGSTLFSTLIGSLFGIFIRTYLSGITPTIIVVLTGFVLLTVLFLTICFAGAFETSVAPIVFLLPLVLLFLPVVERYDIVLLIVFVFLAILLFRSLQHASTELAMGIDIAVRGVVNSGKLPLWKAERAFVSDYFSKACHNCGTENKRDATFCKICGEKLP